MDSEKYKKFINEMHIHCIHRAEMYFRHFHACRPKVALGDIKNVLHTVMAATERVQLLQQ